MNERYLFSLNWGKRKLNELSFRRGAKRFKKILWRDHDALYICINGLRIRLMKPHLF